MDMELQRVQLGGFRAAYEGALRQEETLESIVPDALPDIDRIISAAGNVLLRQKETVEGSARVMGSVRLSVLYSPEGGGAVCSIALNIPFLCSADNPAITSGSQVHVTAGLLCADAKALNPRKILARAEISIGLSVYKETTESVTVGVQGGEAAEVLTVRCRDYFTADVAEKYFSFHEAVRLPASKPAPEALLAVRAAMNCAETKLIGKKLVAKGEILLTFLYRGEGGVCSACVELPFSQVLEIKAEGEDCTAVCSAVLTGLTCTLEADETIAVDAEALFEAAVRQEREVELLADLYSLRRPLEVQRQKVSFVRLREQGARRQITRQLCPTDVPARQVVDCVLSMGEAALSAEGQAVSATARAYADLLFLGEDGNLYAASFVIPACCELPTAESCRCGTVGEVSAMPVAGGVEVRFETEFRYLSDERADAAFVSAVQPGPVPREEDGRRPSVILRMMRPGEQLWDIAKCCGSTVADIKAVNGISDEEAHGRLLLVPSRR